MAESLTKERIFKIWAPPNSLWSPWAKPVLFASIHGKPLDAELPPIAADLTWVPASESKTALVLDLPREQGVLIGLELARLGYRPVPLYNAMPEPTSAETANVEGAYLFAPVVEVAPIRDALWRGTENLERLALPTDAPPAFLLDANRRVGRWMPMPGNFDNRSVSFTTDFPSALFLQRQGITRALLLQHAAPQPQSDLAHTLRRWQDAGIAVQLKLLDKPGAPAPCDIEKPSWFGAIWYRVLVGAGMRPHELGGYGGIIGVSAGG